jgi:hypothetical protein
LRVFPKHQLLGDNKMAMTAEKALQNNKSILQNFGLGEELDEQAAEIISGGSERFLIRNRTKYQIRYTVDGATSVMQPGEADRWISFKGGKITFDTDSGQGIKRKSYNLSDNKLYEFQPNKRTRNPNDIDLYRVGNWS